MAEFRISRIRYTWRNAWSPARAYNRDDVIRYGGSTYVCVRQHTSTTFAQDQVFLANQNDTEPTPAWIRMTDGRAWRAQWATATLYDPGDLALYGGVIYLCVTSHTSQATFDASLANWAVYLSADHWRTDWTAATRYGIGDVIRYNGIVYRCIVGHTSASVALGLEIGNNDNQDDSTGELWQIVYEGVEYVGTWTAATRYRLNDLVKYGGSILRCVTGHTADSTINNNNFVTEFPGFNFSQTWSAAAYYAIGDLVRHGGYLYVANANNYQQNPAADDVTQWNLVSKGINFSGVWDADVNYKTGDLVRRGGNLYVATADTGNDGSSLDYLDASNWEVVTQGQNFRGSWAANAIYGVNDLVIFLGSTYAANVEHEASNENYPGDNGSGFFYWDLILQAGQAAGMSTRGDLLTFDLSDTLKGDGSTFGPAAVNIGLEGQLASVNSESSVIYKTWGNVNRVVYVATDGVDDVTVGVNVENVIDNNYSNGSGALETFIITTVQNPAGSGAIYQVDGVNRPMLNLVRGGVYTFVQSAGSNNNHPIAFRNADNTSFTTGVVSTGVPGSAGAQTVFTVPANAPDSLRYYCTVHGNGMGNIITVTGTSNVSTDSTLYTQRGYSSFYPWRTVRFACEQMDDGFAGTTTVRVAAGRYDEITPIIVPARTVVLGAELRSTTIRAAGPDLSLASDSTYTIAVLERIRNLLVALVNGTAITKSDGNLQDPVVPFQSTQVGVPFDPPQYEGIPTVPPTFDANGAELLTPGPEIFASFNTVVTPLAVDADTITRTQTLITNIIAYINFNILSTGGTNPIVSSTNSVSTIATVIAVSTALEQNRNFLTAESVAFMQTTFPAYEFDADRYRTNVNRFITAFKYDIIYTGNYKSLFEARYYRNAVLGCQATEDMFYCRNATGVRNCTLTGLESALNPPAAFDLYQKPLGGAFCSLDPGWGPADERTWILTRSPYIQGVTTIGTGCVGQKIDGALHNGGNRSMVSNDFTQVISDGIGAWTLNNGRAELVSVFTYYAHIGYLAEDGGIMRSLNGNCSYGTYGALADGVDATEVPATAVSYTRFQQASVAAVFAGDFVDEIQILEFANCGENYTTATGTFKGAGVNAEVLFDDFRDDAVFEARLLDANAGTEQIAQAIGGGGHVLVQNNAQTGTATSITIASNDANSITQYQGMRIILTSGAGTGQFGIVTAYNNVTKVVQVTRESDGQPGWDHVVPGKLPTVPLLPNTTYRIEPRVIFSAPAYAAEQIVVPVSTTWSEVVFGDTTETYNNVAVNEEGTGSTIDVAAAFATFNVSKIGRGYSFTINNSGAGYSEGQLLTINGDLIGGASPINDLLILVTQVSDDSTNSILSAQRKTYGTGEDAFAASGRFVVVSSAGSAALYSADGITWSDFNMPSAGEWKCLAAGLNRFVAIRKGSSAAASSLDGVTWTARTMPFSLQWNSCIYGGNVFLAVATDSNAAAYSVNGTTWTTVPLPSFGDSTLNEWVDVAYGKNRFVVVANSNNTVAVGTYNSTTNTWAWAGQIMDVIDDSSQKDWVSIAYGNDRFVAISSTGDVAYSFQGTDWLPATMPSQDGSTAHNWKKIRYAQGVFFAVGDTGGREVGGDPAAVPTNYAATSFDGVVWTSRELASTKEWVSVAFGSPYVDARDSSVGKSTPTWIVIDNTDTFNKIQTGATALGRVTLSSGIIRSIKLWDPGSGYTEGPSCTIVDPNNNSDAIIECRTADGVLSQPSWLNRGLGYRTLSTTVTINGDGFADQIPTGKFIVINDLVAYPGPGASLTIGDLPGFYTLIVVEPLGQTDRGLAARIRISPELKNRDNLQHLTPITIRTQFSQIRITGHDFLDIGTGNFIETNYPALYSGFYTPAPEDEVVEQNRGRVFYTSTDQSGNFRAGELFAVEQATGIVTIAADFFDLGGLSELKLGGIRVGGTGAVVREFSTDPLFIEDSNNIVPTQRAIRAFLAGRLSIGGSEIAVGSFIAGTILVGPDRINNTAGLRIIFPVLAEFDAPNSGISGSILAQTMFYRSFN